MRNHEQPEHPRKSVIRRGACFAEVPSLQTQKRVSWFISSEAAISCKSKLLILGESILFNNESFDNLPR